MLEGVLDGVVGRGVVVVGGGVVVVGGVVDGVVVVGGLVVVVGVVGMVVVGVVVVGVVGVGVVVGVSRGDVVVDTAGGSEVVSAADMMVVARLGLYIEEDKRINAREPSDCSTAGERRH